MSRVRNLVGYSAALTARSAMAVAKIFGVSDMVWSGISRIGIRGGGVQAASGVMVTAESAMLVAAYKRGVELLAGHVAKTNFCVKRGSEHDKQHPAYKLLRRWARHHQVSAFEFRRTMMAQVLTRGNAYAYIVRRNMEPVELLILDAGQIQPYLIQGELLYKVNGREKMLASSDVIHIKGLGFNGFEGLDPIRYYAKEVLGLAIATQNYAAKYYENGGTPQAYLKTDVPLTDELFNRLKGEAGPLKRSLENPHELPILEASDIKAVGLSAEQTQLLSARKDIILDIANLLGLPPHKLGLAISSSYGSLEEENDAFREDALEPWLCQFESEFAKLLTEDEQEQETHDIEAERDDIKRLKLVDAADYLSKLTGSQPLATVNEARAKIGLPPVEGGDDLSKPLNMGNQGGDPNAQPNAAPPEDDSEDEPNEEADGEPEELVDTEERSAVNSMALAEIRRNALTEVYGRMARRLTNALKSVKSVDQLPEFRSKLAENHLPVIQSAFAPIVPLVGGDDPNALAAELVSTFDAALIGLESRSADDLALEFLIDSEVLAEVAFDEIERRCGAGAPGRKGFQPGNTCAGKKKGQLNASDHPLPSAAVYQFEVPYSMARKETETARKKALKKTEKLQAFADKADEDYQAKRKEADRLRGLYKAHLTKGNLDAAERIRKRQALAVDDARTLRWESDNLQQQATEAFHKSIELPKAQTKPIQNLIDNSVSRSDRLGIEMATEALSPLIHKDIHPNGVEHYATTNNRAFAVSNQIHQSNVDRATTWHEYGHVIEHENPGVKRAAQAFLQKRCGNEAPVSMKERFGGDFTAKEVGRKDGFDKIFGERSGYYTGKTYSDGSTEVISKGLEAMARYPAKFAKTDPEYFNFMLGVMRGKY